jgi:ribosome-binding protein aMBF1 (putative translation factor)
MRTDLGVGVVMALRNPLQQRGQLEPESRGYGCWVTVQDPVKIRKKLGQRIRSLRSKKGWSQEDFAHRAGLGRSFAGAIERGEKDIRIRTLCKLAGILGINISQLFKGTDR